MTRLVKRWMVGAVALLGVFGSTVSTWAASAEQVESALKRGVEFLYSKQDDLGSWETVLTPLGKGQIGDQTDGQWGGTTALVTYSLLASGEKTTDPRIQKAINFLGKIDTMRGVYAMGLRSQVWNFLPLSDPIKRLIRRDAEMFLRGCDANGRYGYLIRLRPNEDMGEFHNSTSQYGVLGMWACENADMGLDIPKAYWARVEKGWQSCQGRDGGWHYSATVPDVTKAVALPDEQNARWEGSTATMTAAGIATLFITQDYLRSDDGIDCKGNITNPNIEAGLAWMARNYSPEWRDGYFLYGLERIGVASGVKYFGKFDWYKTGSEQLVNSQNGDGSWVGLRGGVAVNTAFSILFLVRGRAPVVINKLEYTISKDGKSKPTIGPWNERPRDVANISKYLGKKTERDVNWQIVNLKSTPEALQEAPILFIAGNKPLGFKPEEIKILRDYVERGGMILGHADGGSPSFSQSYKKLMKDLFPNATERELPVDHVIYTGQGYLRSGWSNKPKLTGWSNGARELALLFPYDDEARYWQTRNYYSDKAPYAEIMANIYLYAVDKQKGRVKGQTYLVDSDPAINNETTVKMARIEYAGNWNPEPGGWVQFKNVLHNTMKIGLDISPVKLGEGKLTPGAFKLAHLTGTAELKLTDPQIAELKDYMDKGGVLVIDATGGSTAFSESASTLIGKMYQSVPAILAPSDELIHGNGVGFNCTTVKYRRFAMANMRKTLNPRLRVQIEKGHKVLIFSEEDLSTGLVGNPVDGIKGYEPAAATNLMSNIVLYAAGKIPPSAPAQP